MLKIVLSRVPVRGERRYRRDRNQRGDQCILYRRYAKLILEQSLQHVHATPSGKLLIRIMVNKED
jgi:hypothetical protein